MKTEIINCDCCGKVIDSTEQKNIGMFSVELNVRYHSKSYEAENPRFEEVCRDCTDKIVFCVNDVMKQKDKELSDGK